MQNRPNTRRERAVNAFFRAYSHQARAQETSRLATRSFQRGILVRTARFFGRHPRLRLAARATNALVRGFDRMAANQERGFEAEGVLREDIRTVSAGVAPTLGRRAEERRMRNSMRMQMSADEIDHIESRAEAAYEFSGRR